MVLTTRLSTFGTVVRSYGAVTFPACTNPPVGGPTGTPLTTCGRGAYRRGSNGVGRRRGAVGRGPRGCDRGGSRGAGAERHPRIGGALRPRHTDVGRFDRLVKNRVVADRGIADPRLVEDAGVKRVETAESKRAIVA